MTTGAEETDKSISADRGARPVKRSDWIIPSGAGLFTIALFGHVLFGTAGRVLAAPDSDMPLQFIPWRSYGFGELRQGRLPFWTPHVFSGMPFLANAQTAILYPFNILYLLLNVIPATNLTLAMHLFAAVWIAALWCRNRGVSRAAALLGGLAYVCSGQVMLHVYAGHLVYICSIPWIPLVFLCVDHVIEGACVWGWTLLGIFAMAMLILAGYPQMPVYTSVVAGVYALLQLPMAKRRVRIALMGMLMVIGGAALAAAQLLPTYQFAAESARGAELSATMASSFSLAPGNLFTLLLPAPFGDAIDIPYYGRWLFWEQSLWIGLGMLLLALLGVATADRSKRRFAGVIALLCIIASLGDHTPLFWLLYHVPVLNRFRAPARFGLYASLMLSMLAALGADRLWTSASQATGVAMPSVGSGARGNARHGSWPYERWVMFLAIVTGVALVIVAVAFAGDGGANRIAGIIDSIGRFRPGTGQTIDPDVPARAAAALALQAIEGAVVALAIAAMIPLSRRSRVAGGAAMALALGQVLLFAFHECVECAPATNLPTPWASYLDEGPRDARYIVTSKRFLNAGGSFGYDDVWGYDPVLLRRYNQLMAIAIGVDPATADYRLGWDIQNLSPWFAVLRCRAGLAEQNGYLPIIPNPQPAMGHVALFGRCQVHAAGPGVWNALQDSSFDPLHDLALESQPDPAPAECTDAGSAQAIDRDAQTLEIIADLKAPQILLITDAYAPGWKATPIDAAPQDHYKVIPADNGLRAIPLAAGHHHILLHYTAPGWIAGCWISAAALAAYAGAIALWLVSRRRFTI